MGGLSLAQMNHLVVSQRALLILKLLRILFGRGDDGAEEGECRIALAQPEAVAYYWHALDEAWPARMPENGEYAEWVVHNSGCKLK